MDEKVEVKEDDCPWPIESVDDNSFVYRQIPAFKRIGKRPRQYPGEGHFELRADEDSLSFNWEKHIELNQNFKLIGLSYNKEGKYLDYTGYKVFKYSVNHLKQLSKFEAINHSPKFEGAPSAVGSPNNKAHVSLHCGTFDNGTRVSLSDYCIDNFDDSHCAFDVKTLVGEIEDLRIRANDTPYHKDWIFEEVTIFTKQG